jgi:hypothetical protein
MQIAFFDAHRYIATAACPAPEPAPMVRNNRTLIRLSFLLVIGMGLFGGWYAGHAWQIEAGTLAQLGSSGSGDWVDFFATLGEAALQLFLGFTSGQ